MSRYFSDLVGIVPAWILTRAEKFLATEVKAEHWITGPDELLEVPDCCTPFCYECGDQEVARLQELYPDQAEEVLLDGGWGQEGDSVAMCEGCSATLDTTLVSCGYEFSHFEDWAVTLTEQDCYVLAETANAVTDGQYGHDACNLTGLMRRFQMPAPVIKKLSRRLKKEIKKTVTVDPAWRKKVGDEYYWVAPHDQPHGMSMACKLFKTKDGLLWYLYMQGEQRKVMAEYEASLVAEQHQDLLDHGFYPCSGYSHCECGSSAVYGISDGVRYATWTD